MWVVIDFRRRFRVAVLKRLRTTDAELLFPAIQQEDRAMIAAKLSAVSVFFF